MALFGKKTFVISSGVGSATGGSEGLLIKDNRFKFTMGLSETKDVLSHSESFNINLNQAESTPALIESANLSVSGSGLNDTNATLAEALSLKTRYWSTVSSDNDVSRTTPTNANGQNDLAVAIVKTNNSLGNLTNPVVLTSTTFGTPATGTFTAKRIRVFFDIPVRLAALDTLIIQYKLGAAAPATIFTHTGTAALNHSTGTFTSDISGLTLAQIQTISLLASYTSNVVAAPETSIRLDSWSIELEQ